MTYGQNYERPGSGGPWGGPEGQGQGEYQQPYENAPGYQAQPGFTPQGGFGPPRPRKSWVARHKVLTGFGVFAGLVIVISAAASGGGGKSGTGTGAATGNPVTVGSTGANSGGGDASTGMPSAAGTHSAAPAARVVATFTGSGQQNTAKFTTTATWKLVYSFDCRSFGYQGNFIVMEDGSFGALSVNDLALSKSGSTYAYNDAGTHYLGVNSECDWTLKVIDEG